MKYSKIYIFLLAGFSILSSCEDSDKCSSAPTINAGKDTVVINNNSLNLNATTSDSKGSWAIVSGNDGVLENKELATTKFSGKLNSKYKLVWTSENDCGTASDTINIEFRSQLTADEMVANMHWIEQSAYKIVAGGVKIYIDPISIKTKDSADYILITHDHGDHYSTADIAKIASSNTVVIGPTSVKYKGVCKEYKTVKPGDEIVISDNFKIKAVAAYNIVKTSFHPKSANNVGYLVNLEGVVVYHAGDTERIPEMKDFSCDIALVPLGQTYTMNKVEDAAESVKDVKAKIAIPMHYGYAEGKAADATTFKTLLDGSGIKVVIKNKGE